MSKNKTVTRDMYDQFFLPFYAPFDFIPVKGVGSRVWDQQDKEYIDFSGGIAVSCMGHCHPKLLKTLAYQSKLIWHTSNFFVNEPQLRLASKLIQSSFASHIFFSNSGAEVNEAALKLARYYSIHKFGLKKVKIISFHNSFHGRTLFTVYVGGNLSYSKPFGFSFKDIVHLPFNDLDTFSKVINDSFCAVIIELVQGEGGIIPADFLFIQEVRSLCNKYNVLLILDEVQTGIGRTGTLFAYEQYGIIPDMLTIAKSLGGGFPISALLACKKISDIIKKGLHGTTYGGNPLACSIAETVLDFINTKKILSGVIKRSKIFSKKIHMINKAIKIFKEIRIKGLLIGLEFVPEVSIDIKKILKIFSNEGVLVLSAGTNVIRLAPSLIISYEDIDEGMDRFLKAVKLI
ncbi:acetylornithine/succinyldiaminopimelate transaminase [Buchnera aphidicola (Hormaphis cornu)]|nr:acetylornithine/succinyldiaminopimelate transaminase [Buchnera aphidicola (Hormaphis cornu)]